MKVCSTTDDESLRSSLKFPYYFLEPPFTPRDVSIRRNVNAKDLFDVISEVGRGKFGTVYKCKEKETGLTLAAKFVPIPKKEDRRNVEREVEIMNSLQHHLIAQLYAAFEYQKMMCVVQELVEGGELFDRVVEDEFVLSEKVCTVFIRQVCEAMEFIHKNNILHLDLKPENILCITKTGNRIKIIDFGLARKYDPDKKLQILFGTPEFVAPEVVNFDCISYGTDMWSVGVICYVLLSGISPFMGETDIETMANVTVAKYDFDDEAFTQVSKEALDFISKLLVKDLSSRMTATQCLEHTWLKRKPKPKTATKPKKVPPPKLKKNSSKKSPPTTPTTEAKVNGNGTTVTELEEQKKDVELSKDNLKTFIERWEEHPNSPYVFDVESNVIMPLKDSSRNSISSSRVCLSPSPCESIDSVSDDVFLDKNENQIPNTPTTSSNSDIQEYLHSFERRNSDTSFLVNRRSSVGERMNLAEEIRKLSDHLMMLAEINKTLEKDKDSVGGDGEVTPTNEDPKEPIFIAPKPKTSKLSVRLQRSIEETPTLNNSSSTSTSTSTTHVKRNGFRSSRITTTTTSSSITTTTSEDAHTKRMKFKVNQMSRDVPVGQPDTHQTVNLEEAANATKDCLLHLLDKYNERKTRNPLGRHQSFSVDWNSSNNLQYRSMSSINAFFQRQNVGAGGRNIRQLQAQLLGGKPQEEEDSN
ncbi:hypothetical protein ACFFRR_008367 [Megaselia abdita]